MTKAAFLLSAEARALVYSGNVWSRLRPLADFPAASPSGADGAPPDSPAPDTEVIFSGWGAPVLDESLLETLPALKAVFYGGGSVRYFVTEALWTRGVRLTAAAAINAIPVADYTVSTVLLGLKRFWHYARLTRTQQTFPAERPVRGAYHARIGLVSYGTIARLVRERLRAHELEVAVYDPFLTPEEAAIEGVRRVGLDELFATCDVVSLHTPLLPETVGLIRGAHLRLMKPDALFINTARGEIVHEPEMLAALAARPDLQAILDVTAPEPPRASSPLYTLPNVILTPHIAGSLGPECQRMGHAMVDEFERYLARQPLQWEVTPGRAAHMA